MSDLDLTDLITEGQKAKKQSIIAKAAKKVAAERDKTPLPDGPPIRRDIYQQLEWKALSVTLVTITTTCDCCGSITEAPNPHIFLERYHRRHGRHLVEVNNFNLLPKRDVEQLPRRIETHYRTSLYCHQCFIKQESICLTQPMISLTQESSPSEQLPCVPQALAMPSMPTLWSDTFGATSKSMNSWSKSSEQSKPNGKADYY